MTHGFVELAHSLPAGQKSQVLPLRVSPSPGWVKNNIGRKCAQPAATGEQRAAHEKVQCSAPPWTLLRQSWGFRAASRGGIQGLSLNSTQLWFMNSQPITSIPILMFREFLEVEEGDIASCLTREMPFHQHPWSCSQGEDGGSNAPWAQGKVTCPHQGR